jgi:hypothetical protein
MVRRRREAWPPVFGALTGQPLGRCRQFMRDVDEGNLEAHVILGPDRAVKLAEVLPFHEWPRPVDMNSPI